MPSIIISGAEGETLHRLGKKPFVIGRHVACSAQVLDEKVSRRHLQIRSDEESGKYHLLDLRSGNGTFVNDRRIAGETELVEGDRIRIGDTTIYFTLNDFPDQASALNAWRKAGERGKSTIHMNRG